MDIIKGLNLFVPAYMKEHHLKVKKLAYELMGLELPKETSPLNGTLTMMMIYNLDNVGAYFGWKGLG